MKNVLRKLFGKSVSAPNASPEEHPSFLHTDTVTPRYERAPEAIPGPCEVAAGLGKEGVPCPKNADAVASGYEPPRADHHGARQARWTPLHPWHAHLCWRRPWLAAGMTNEQVIEEFPELTLEDIRASLAYAADRDHLVGSVA